MSAFVVSEDHIRAMIQAGFSRPGFELSWLKEDSNNLETYEELVANRQQLTAKNASEVGQMLKFANVLSVAHRYNPADAEELSFDNLPGPIDEDPCGRFTFPIHGVKRRTSVEILKLINCYEYQSCEFPGWEDSEAFRFCESLKEKMIRELPGYEDAAWQV